MTTWSRRQALRALGLGTAGAAHLPWLAACARFRQTTVPAAIDPPRSWAEVHAILRDLVGGLGQQLPNADASATATRRRIVEFAVDAGERSIATEEIAAAAFAIIDRSGARREQVTTDLSAAGLARAAKAIAGQAVPSAAQFVPAKSARLVPRDDPTQANPGDLLEQMTALFERGRSLGGSRIVYRSAYLKVDERDMLHIGRERDLAQRSVGTRTGLLLLATARASLVVERAERAGIAGLDSLQVSDDELAAAADNALAHLSVRPAPTGEIDVLLDPSVAALLLHRCVARPLARELWHTGAPASAAHQQRICSEIVGLRDDPTAADGYGSTAFDALGEPATPTDLIRGGVLANPLALPRRATPLAVATDHPSNLIMAPGQLARDDLIAALDRGLVLEGGLSAHVDLQRWHGTVRAARASEVDRGKLTGRRYGPVLLTGAVPAMLRSIRGLSAIPQTFALDSAPAVAESLPSTVTTPFVQTRALVVGQATEA